MSINFTMDFPCSGICAVVDRIVIHGGRRPPKIKRIVGKTLKGLNLCNIYRVLPAFASKTGKGLEIFKPFHDLHLPHVVWPYNSMNLALSNFGRKPFHVLHRGLVFCTESSRRRAS